jgi:hypothetical protein
MVLGRESKYSPGTEIVWYGSVDKNNIEVVRVDSTFNATGYEEIITKKWAEFIAENPDCWDGDLWRVEEVLSDGAHVSIHVSPSKYSHHIALAFEQGQPKGFYPNPLGVHPLQITADGYIPLGKRERESLDGIRTVWDPVGGGYVNPKEQVCVKSLKPEGVFETAGRECRKETTYGGASTPYNISEARAIAVLYGDVWHDTEVTMKWPLNVERKYINLRGGEHSDLIFLSANNTSIRTFLDDAGFGGIPASKFLLADLEMYVLQQQ